jgi:hypothetical protein
MTRDQFNEALAAIGWSRAVLADRLGLSSDRIIRRWSAGTHPVPPRIEEWLILVARTLRDIPPPTDW